MSHKKDLEIECATNFPLKLLTTTTSDKSQGRQERAIARMAVNSLGFKYRNGVATRHTAIDHPIILYLDR